METKWKEVVNRNKKKKRFCSSSNSHYLALQGSAAHHIQKEDLTIYFLEHFKKKNPTQKKHTKKKNHLTAPTDTRPFKGADQLRPEIILLHQKILNYISIITELISDFSNRTHIHTSSGISFPYFVSQIFAY